MSRDLIRFSAFYMKIEKQKVSVFIVADHSIENIVGTAAVS